MELLYSSHVMTKPVRYKIKHTPLKAWLCGTGAVVRDVMESMKMANDISLVMLHHKQAQNDSVQFKNGRLHDERNIQGNSRYMALPTLSALWR